MHKEEQKDNYIEAIKELIDEYSGIIKNCLTCGEDREILNFYVVIQSKLKNEYKNSTNGAFSGTSKQAWENLIKQAKEMYEVGMKNPVIKNREFLANSMMDDMESIGEKFGIIIKSEIQQTKNPEKVREGNKSAAKTEQRLPKETMVILPGFDKQQENFNPDILSLPKKWKATLISRDTQYKTKEGLRGIQNKVASFKSELSTPEQVKSFILESIQYLTSVNGLENTVKCVIDSSALEHVNGADSDIISCYLEKLNTIVFSDKKINNIEEIVSLLNTTAHEFSHFMTANKRNAVRENAGKEKNYQLPRLQ